MALTRYDKALQRVVDQMFEDITHTPGGYAYLQQLPKKGRSSKAALRLRWRRKLAHIALPEPVKLAMVKASLTEEGQVDTRGVGLVNHLLRLIYVTPERLYKTWFNHCAPPTSSARRGQP